MSDLLTHWAVFEDCRRLAAGDPTIDPTLQAIIESEREFARLGAITRDGNEFMASLLRGLRERRAQGEAERQEARDAAKVGFILGCLTHQACDNAMKPIISKAADGDWSKAHTDIWAGVPGARERFKPHNEISAYYDTWVYRKVYLEGGAEPFTPAFLSDVEGTAAEALEEFVQSLFQRALLSSHTVKPDLTDPERWLDTLFGLYQDLYVDVRTYVRVLQRPDPAKLQQFAVETEFYVEDDPIIRAARAVQADGEIPADIVRESLTVESSCSGYGRAIALGLDYLRAGSALWTGKTDELETPNWDGHYEGEPAAQG